MTKLGGGLMSEEEEAFINQEKRTQMFLFSLLLIHVLCILPINIFKWEFLPYYDVTKVMDGPRSFLSTMQYSTFPHSYIEEGAIFCILRSWNTMAAVHFKFYVTWKTDFKLETKLLQREI